MAVYTVGVSSFCLITKNDFRYFPTLSNMGRKTGGRKKSPTEKSPTEESPIEKSPTEKSQTEKKSNGKKVQRKKSPTEKKFKLWTFFPLDIFSVGLFFRPRENFSLKISFP